MAAISSPDTSTALPNSPRAWCRKRTAWQAVSDTIADPQAMRLKLERTRAELQRALDALPAGAQAWRAVAVDVDDPEQFSRQLRAIYLLSAAMLRAREMTPAFAMP